MREDLAPPANSTPSLRSSMPVNGAKRTWHTTRFQPGAVEDGRRDLEQSIHTLWLYGARQEDSQRTPSGSGEPAEPLVFSP